MAAPLAGKHALTTGGGTGIGATMARKLADAGAAVSLAGCRAAPVREAAQAAHGPFGKVDLAHRERMLGVNLTGRFAMPERVADAVLWLCMPAAQAITGQAIAVSGGET